MRKEEITLNDRLGALIQGMGYEFVGCELLRQGRHSLLRVYIDVNKREKGVTVDDCARVSNQVSAMLDVEDPIQSQYTLEVSSPGLNRPLFNLSQYERSVGESVKLRLRAPIEERRNFSGVLLRVEGDKIHLLMDAEEIVLPFSNIEKANIIAEIR